MACDSNSKLDTVSIKNLAPGWQLMEVEGIERLVKEYKFKNFVLAMHFSNEIAELAEMHNHHPMIITEWGKVTLHWWTHTAQGISELDIKLSKLSDQLA